MKRLTGNLIAKIAAVTLSYVMIIILAFSLLFTVIMGYYKFYFSNKETVVREIITDMAQNEADYIDSLLHMETNLEEYYRDKNVYFEIVDVKSGKVIHSNYDNQPYFVSAESEHYLYDEYYIEENGSGYWETVSVHAADIKLYVAESMTKNDIFSVVKTITEFGFKLRFAMIFILIGSLICEIVLLCFLYCAAGHDSQGNIKLNPIDKIPFDIYTAFIVVAAILSIILVDYMSFNKISAVIWIFIVGTVDYFLALGYTMSFATRVKKQSLIKGTLLYKILSFIATYLKKHWKRLKYALAYLPVIKKTVLGIAIVLVAEIIGIIIALNTYWYEPIFLILCIVIANILFISLSVYIAITINKIRTASEKIAQGDLDYKINTEYMYGDFKRFAESLNNIRGGLQTAVNERIKSEHFKTELITNVSHDIKTPLTSIINYVDLIKKQEPQDEDIKEYISILVKQSSRLKKLVEDLVEASKASSGTLPVNLSVCDVGVLLTQTVGEFEDRLKKAEIIPIVNKPENPVNIMADARQLWRVFDNLMNNICKYALGSTRVYLDITVENKKAYITFRNISKYQLNISSNELMERFVRGDSSRNSEGSGLGLSIAKSLVELQNGKMDLTVDGDLFKVTLIFDTIV